ncbi:MAG: cell division protein FtsA [Coraliomargaritaceae bacterium]
MSQDRVVGAVEIGTSKVAVLLGEIVGKGGLNIIGHVAATSKGVKKGMISDLYAASDCVHAAIMTAEKNANTRIEEVYLAQTGAHLQGVFNVGVTSVRSANGVVEKSDIEQAKEDAKGRDLPTDQTYIHHIRNPFRLDGQALENPLAQVGRRLEVGYWSVHGDSQNVSNSLSVIRGFNLHVRDMIISSIASGVILLEEAEKEAGALVIDIGAGTSDYVLYRNGYIVKTGVVSVGGDHITNDLSIGLRVGRKGAEEIKIKHGCAVYRSSDREETVWLYGDLTIGDRQYPKAAITRIIDARVGEIFSIIKEQLEAASLFQASDIAAGIVLTGGTSRLDGIAEAAESQFGLEARLASGPPDVAPELRCPEYSTALGLLHYALTGQEEAQESAKPYGFLRHLTNILNNEK